MLKILVKDVSYFKGLTLVHVAKGTVILVDETKGIARYGKDHFFIDEEEWTEITNC